MHNSTRFTVIREGIKLKLKISCLHNSSFLNYKYTNKWNKFVKDLFLRIVSTKLNHNKQLNTGENQQIKWTNEYKWYMYHSAVYTCIISAGKILKAQCLTTIWLSCCIRIDNRSFEFTNFFLHKTHFNSIKASEKFVTLRFESFWLCTYIFPVRSCPSDGDNSSKKLPDVCQL